MKDLSIDENNKLIYIHHLVGRIFKILPLTEENNNKIPKMYVSRLIIDVNSANSLFDGLLIELIVKLNSLYENNNLLHEEIKSIIFECISFCRKIQLKGDGRCDT